MYCAKQQSVFGRLFTMDCQKHALEHCVIGLFGWMNRSFRSLCVSADKLIARTNTVLSDEQQKRTLDTVTNQL